MYLRRVARERWPVWAMLARSRTPAAAGGESDAQGLAGVVAGDARFCAQPYYRHGSGSACQAGSVDMDIGLLGERCANKDCFAVSAPFVVVLLP